MRVSHHCAAMAAVLVSMCSAGVAMGQAGPPAAARPAAAAPAGGTNVAVIDIAFVFKHHNRFNTAMNEIKQEIEKFEAYVREEQRKFSAKKEELTAFRTGTPEYNAKEEELARTASEMQVQVSLKRKQFLEDEARVYYRVYREIEQSVGIFAQRNRIGLVMRFNGDDMKENDRASVLQGVNRAVVYQQNLDITQFILDDLNRGPSNTTQGGAVAPQNATRPIVPGKSGVQR